MNPVRSRLAPGTAGLDKLALSIVLPGDYEPLRFPTLPVELTSVVSFKTTGINYALSVSSRRFALLRDAAYPFWGDRNFSALCNYVTIQGGMDDAGDSTFCGNITRVDGAVGVSPSVDSQPVTVDAVCDLMPVIRVGRSYGFYIPPNGVFRAEITLNTTMTPVPTLGEFTVSYWVNGEALSATMQMVPISTGSYTFVFSGTPNSTTCAEGSITAPGKIPVGFCVLESAGWTTTLSGTATDSFTAKLGWTTGGTFATPTGSRVMFLPLRVPAEFGTSEIPYLQTRTNAAALLITNVTSILNKEGTVQGARLLGSACDPWFTTEAVLSSVHQKYRFYGPLEKGLYTFTTPTNHGTEFFDHAHLIINNGALSQVRRPIFNPNNLVSYNAIICTDVVSGSTVLACSVWNHLEFITSSSLFDQETSRFPLQGLHTAETALLHLGMFHENPTHFAYIGNMAMKALRMAAPMVLPYAQGAALKLLDMGYERIMRGPKPEEKPKPKPAQKPKPKIPGKKPKAVIVKKKK